LSELFKGFKGKIIWSADGISLEELIRIVDGNFPRNEVAVKLDRLFLTMYGLSAISEVQKRGVAVFADAKIIEIPSKVDDIVKLHLEHQPWMLNIMAGACNNGFTKLHLDVPNYDELNEFSRLCAEAGTKSCAVTVLTSKNKRIVEMEFERETEKVVEFYAGLSINCGLTDIVCSPDETEIVRKLGRIDINTPGVRLPGSKKDDQERVKTPFEALELGATRLVIGRDLSRDGEFHKNLAKIMANIEGGN